MMQMAEFLLRVNNNIANVDQNYLSKLTTPRLTENAKSKSSYCQICEQRIYREGKRNQGAKRHILQYHLKESLFECSLGDYSSKFDEAHVRNHIKQKHTAEECATVINRVEESNEKIVYWYEKCFGMSACSIRSKMSAQMLRKPSDLKERSSTELGFSPPSNSTSGASSPDSLRNFPMSDLFGSSFTNQQVPMAPQLPLMNDQMFQIWMALAANPMLGIQPTLTQEVQDNQTNNQEESRNEQSKSSFMIKDILGE